MSQSKIYLLVREDLDPTYRSAQGTHAAIELCKKGLGNLPCASGGISTLVQLAVKNEEALEHWSWKLDCKNKQYASFREPDLAGQLTAIACVDTGEIFKTLQLAG
jgi:hypothetical protein